MHNKFLLLGLGFGIGNLIGHGHSHPIILYICGHGGADAAVEDTFL